MTSIADSSVRIQTSSDSVPSTPCWFGEVALLIPSLRKQGILSVINVASCVWRVAASDAYAVIDFLAVLFGYAISGERTLEAFYEQLLPFAQPFMALFEREHLPSRSALSRDLSSLSPTATEALRTLFLADLLARPLDTERHTGQLVDRKGTARVVFDIDGTGASRSATSLATDRGTACTPASLEPGLCAWLHRAQARGGRADAHRRLAGP